MLTRILLAVDLRAFAARGREQFLPQRIVDDAVFHAAAPLHGDRHSELRKAVQEIGGAVERIDDPDEFAVCTAAVALAAFLGENRVIGIVLANGLDDVPLGCRSISVTKSF